MTPFETILIAAIGTGIVGIATFITWLVKFLLPKIIEHWEKISTAVEKFPEILVGIQTEIKVTNQLCVENKFEIQKLRQDLFDKRLEELQTHIESIESKRNINTNSNSHNNN